MNVQNKSKGFLKRPHLVSLKKTHSEFLIGRLFASLSLVGVIYLFITLSEVILSSLLPSTFQSLWQPFFHFKCFGFFFLFLFFFAPGAQERLRLAGRGGRVGVYRVCGGGELLSVVLIRQRSINILGTRGQARAGRVTRESSNGEEDEEDQRGPKRTRRTRMARMIRSLRAK